MKGRICLWICAVLLCGIIAGNAERLDFSGMTLSELYAARDAIEARIGELEQQQNPQVYESGSYHVGEDIPAGDYVLVEKEDAVFASAILRQGVTEDSGLLAHHLINRQAIVRVQQGTWLTLTDARAYPLSQAVMQQDGRVSEGGYLVGVTLKAGGYVVHVDDKAPLSSYSIYDGILGVGAQLTKFEVVHADTRIELNDGDYIELSGCSLTQENPVDGGM